MDAMKITQNRIRLLKTHVDVEKVITMQGCVWNELKKTNSKISKFVAEFKSDRVDRRLSMRQTFRGGLVSKKKINLWY
jgi:hypothetical protein